MGNDTKKRRKPPQTYKYKQNAVNVTVYDPHGETIPAEVRHKIEESVLQVAIDNGLLINIALT